MNHYPSYPHTPASGSGHQDLPPSSMPSDPRLPPRPPPQSYPPVANQSHRSSASGSASGSGSYNYPPFPPPPAQSFPSGPPPPQRSFPYSAGNSGQDNYGGGLNQSPVREQRYDPGHNRGEGSGSGSYNQAHQYVPPPPQRPQQNEPYPSLPPLRFTDRPSPPNPGSDRGNAGYQGYTVPVNNQLQGLNNGPGPGFQQSAPAPTRNYGEERPRENFNTRTERSGRDRSPDRDPGRKPYRSLADRDRDGRTLEARLQLERACRTLFVRNVNYEANTDGLRTDFERYGQIKTYFDLVKQRGMIFITYYDLRVAEKARDGMHDSVVNNRKIDVHYSLPRADDQKKPADRESNQGSIVATLLRQPFLHENDLGRMCEAFGDIKIIRPGRTPDQKVVEFFDARGAALFFDEKNHQPFQGGTLELMFIWDEPEGTAPPPPPGPGQRDSRSQEGARTDFRPGPPPFENRRDDRGGGHRGGRGGGRGGRRSGEGPGYGEVRGGRFDDGRGDDEGGYGRRGSGGVHRDGPPGHAGPPPGRYDAAPPAPPIDDRLEQARKVQDLLASLSGTVAPAPQQSPQNGYQPARSNNQPQIQGYSSAQPPVSAPYRPGDPRNPRQSNGSAMPPFPPGGPGPSEQSRYNAAPTSGYNAAPPPQNTNYAPPSQNNAGPPPQQGGNGIPAEVLSLLQANNAGPPPLPPTASANHPYPPPAHQGYQSGPAQNTAPYRPSPLPPQQQYGNAPYSQGQGQYQQGGQQGYRSGPGHSQQQGGYQAGPGGGGGGAKDVGSLLAMLGNR